jgi:heptosyltransferase-2
MNSAPQKILVIQTAFIGDVILATALVEKMHRHFPQADIDILVRKGNESLLKDHPFLRKVLIWDKKTKKYSNLLRIARQIRSEHYDIVVNTQRFFATGFLTAFSGAQVTSGFQKNPFAFLFTHSILHEIGTGIHEVERNQKLIEPFTSADLVKPKLYPSESDLEKVAEFKTEKYITISPTSVWFTKQFPVHKWVEFIDRVPSEISIYLLGGPGDKACIEDLMRKCSHPRIKNLAGKLSFLQSAALMQDAEMNYVNDSGPLHLCSAVNARVTAVFCSTIPEFGFTPLSEIQFVVETQEKLDCRPCGLHGKTACPRGDFRCAESISTNVLISTLSQN